MVASLRPCEVLRLAVVSCCFYSLQGHECSAVLWTLCLWQTVLVGVLGRLASKTCVGRRWVSARLLQGLDLVEGLIYVWGASLGHDSHCGQSVSSGMYMGLALLALLKVYSIFP